MLFTFNMFLHIFSYMYHLFMSSRRCHMFCSPPHPIQCWMKKACFPSGNRELSYWRSVYMKTTSLVRTSALDRCMNCQHILPSKMKYLFYVKNVWHEKTVAVIMSRLNSITQHCMGCGGVEIFYFPSGIGLLRLKECVREHWTRCAKK